MTKTQYNYKNYSWIRLKTIRFYYFIQHSVKYVFNCLKRRTNTITKLFVTNKSVNAVIIGISKCTCKLTNAIQFILKKFNINLINFKVNNNYNNDVNYETIKTKAKKNSNLHVCFKEPVVQESKEFVKSQDENNTAFLEGNKEKHEDFSIDSTNLNSIDSQIVDKTYSVKENIIESTQNIISNNSIITSVIDENNLEYGNEYKKIEELHENTNNIMNNNYSISTSETITNIVVQSNNDVIENEVNTGSNNISNIDDCVESNHCSKFDMRIPIEVSNNNNISKNLNCDPNLIENIGIELKINEDINNSVNLTKFDKNLMTEEYNMKNEQKIELNTNINETDLSNNNESDSVYNIKANKNINKDTKNENTTYTNTSTNTTNASIESNGFDNSYHYADNIIRDLNDEFTNLSSNSECNLDSVENDQDSTDDEFAANFHDSPTSDTFNNVIEEKFSANIENEYNTNQKEANTSNYDNTIVISTDIAEEYKNKGNISFKNNNYKEAIELYLLGLKHCPEENTNLRAIILANISQSEYNLNNYERALEAAKGSIEIDQKYAKGHLKCYLANYKLKNIHQAAKDLEEACKLDSNINGVYKVQLQRVKNESNIKLEQEKAEMMNKLKSFGNWALGKVGMSINDFDVVQDPSSGSYSIKYKNQTA